ncbi:unnamed protein product, partial [Musa acuminata subsp. burmannicoides]
IVVRLAHLKHVMDVLAVVEHCRQTHNALLRHGFFASAYLAFLVISRLIVAVNE